MQIGNPELDRVCEKSMVPALKAFGLDPKRVDKHNQGGLLKSEIINFINDSAIIVADLTNERPNCYLEVGYAMGRDKFKKLILTAREDHNPDSPNHRLKGPKVHFDLVGYDVLFWDPQKLDEFRADLERRIRRRRETFVPVTSPKPPWDEAWIERHRAAAKAGLKNFKRTGFMEIRFTLHDARPNKNSRDLLAAAEAAQSQSIGYSIGLVLRNHPEYRPRPKSNEIVTEIAEERQGLYDYWALRNDGDFYLLQSLWEDLHASADNTEPKRIFYDHRIAMITEVLLYCRRLYSRLGVPQQTTVYIAIRHGGLGGRVLRAENRESGMFSAYLSLNRPASQDEDERVTPVPLGRIKADLTELVKDLTEPLFMLFDYVELASETYARITEQFSKREK
jgi:hypothetical protein